MRYWCAECKSEINIQFKDNPKCCYICREVNLIELPDFETPQQYKKRTGKKWNGAVWVWFDNTALHKGHWEATSMDNAEDPLNNYHDSWLKARTVIANSPNPPLDDYDWEDKEQNPYLLSDNELDAAIQERKNR